MQVILKDIFASWKLFYHDIYQFNPNHKKFYGIIMKKYFGYRLAPSNFFLYKLNFYLFSFFLLFSANIKSQSLSAENIYKKVSDAVVVIYAYDSNNKLAKQGSGVVINNKGYVVTNYHVLAGNDRIEILHNKTIIPYVDIIGIDVEKDILILKIDKKKFPAVKIGDSKSLNIGQRIYSIGSPLGFENTISEGIISGLRSNAETGKNFIQITASISSGSSGGAVVNEKGELIGISTLTVKEGQNLNFAIPIHDVLDVEISSYIKDDTYKDYELFSKGYYASEKGNYQKAIEYYSLFLRKYPKSAGTYNNRGEAKRKLEDYRGAIQDYNKAIERKPSNEELYYHNRGIAKGQLGDYRGSIQDFNKAIEIEPDNAQAFFNRGYTKSKLEDYRGAIQDYNKAIELNPLYSDAYHNRGSAKRQLEDYRGSIQDFNKAIEINPLFASSYLLRGVSKYALGDKAGACLDWSKAGELGDSDAYVMIKEFCH